MYCYSNNGLSWHLVEENYTPQTGEQTFEQLQTPAQLAAAFPNYSTANSNISALSAAQAALPESDTTMHRIGEAVGLGLNSWTSTDVVAWVNYRRSLRAIIKNSGGTMPSKPAYPAGT